MTNDGQIGSHATPVRFRASPDTVAQRLGEEVVLIHLKSDKIFVLNRTGARLWDLLCSGLACADIYDRMLQEFDVSETQLATEAETLLTSLKNEQLVIPA